MYIFGKYGVVVKSSFEDDSGQVKLFITGTRSITLITFRANLGSNVQDSSQSYNTFSRFWKILLRISAILSLGLGVKADYCLNLRLT